MLAQLGPSWGPAVLMSDSSPHHYQVYPSIPDGCPFVKYELRGWCRHVVLWGSTVGTPDHEPYPMDPIL